MIVGFFFFPSTISNIPQLVNNRVIVPLRVIGESLGYDVSWNNARRTVVIKDTDESLTVDAYSLYYKEQKTEAFALMKEQSEARDSVQLRIVLGNLYRLEKDYSTAV